MSGGRNSVVMRFYRESSEPDSCAQAVRLLLSFTESKQKATRPGGPNDAKDLENDRTDPQIISK